MAALVVLTLEASRFATTQAVAEELGALQLEVAEQVRRVAADAWDGTAPSHRHLVRMDTPAQQVTLDGETADARARNVLVVVVTQPEPVTWCEVLPT